MRRYRVSELQITIWFGKCKRPPLYITRNMFVIARKLADWRHGYSMTTNSQGVTFQLGGLFLVLFSADKE
jgi:hypothetical protein